MPISFDQKLVFVHIPKTGGISISKLMGIDGYALDLQLLTGKLDDWSMRPRQFVELTHLTANEIRNRSPESFNSFFKFAVVRNPWDRAVSEYRYRETHGFKFPYITNVSSFSDFCEAISQLDMSTLTHYDKAHIRPQYEYVYGNNQIIVDKIFRFESLNDVEPIFGKPLPHLNATGHTDYRTWYNTKTADYIASVYSVDISAFNYSLDIL